MKTCLSAERLASYRKTFGSLTTQELKAIVEGRKPHRLSEEALEALRRLLEQREGSGHVTVQLTDAPNIRRDSAQGRHRSVAKPPSAEPKRDMNRGASKQQLPFCFKQTWKREAVSICATGPFMAFTFNPDGIPAAKAGVWSALQTRQGLLQTACPSRNGWSPTSRSSRVDENHNEL